VANSHHPGHAVALLFCMGLVTGCAAQVAASKQAAAIKRGAPEMCFGVARGGHNDCRTAAHICAGWARQDADPGAFVYVPAGTCERIVGGSLDATKR
jgi:uncharacterized membrane protein